MKRCSKLLRVLAVVGIWLAIIMPATPVLADTSLPDSTPTVVSFNLYRNLLETGDVLLLIYANIPYATPPDDPVTDTFVWRMVDTDNVTELGSTTGYAYNENGYGYNVSSMYWDSDNVTALGITWEAEYIVKLNGNPAFFDTPPEYIFTLSTTDYTTATVTADVSTEMGERILDIAHDLNIKWALTVLLNLTQEDETGTVLSRYGESFFRGVVLGLQGMVPQIFPFNVGDLEATAREWDEEYSENLTSQWAGTWVETAQAASTTLFSTDYDLPSLLMLVTMAIGMVFCGLIVAHDSWGGLMDASIVILLGTRLSMLGLGYLGLIVAMCVLYISARMWGIARG